MSILLKNGVTTEDRRLDRIPLFDPESRNFSIAEVVEELPLKSKVWICRPRFDQGEEGACVKFGWAHDHAAMPVQVHGITEPMIFDWYHLVQHADPWDGCSLGQQCPIEPGPQYDGTAVLAGAKFAQEKGYIGEYRWVFGGVIEMARAIAHEGPAVIGVNWHEGMSNTDEYGFIHPTGSVRGGHAVCVRGVRLVPTPSRGEPDLDRSFFIIRNSWGWNWGIGGDCRITFSNMQKLLDARGEVCIPMNRARP